MNTARVRLWIFLLAAPACAAPPGHEVANSAAENGEAPGAPAPLVSGPAPGWLPGDPCDPQTEGWKPEAIPLTEKQQEQASNGQPSLQTFPPGYQWKAPVGVPECVGSPGMEQLQASCQSNADCPAGAVCPAGYDYCVTPCKVDSDCTRPNECLSGRLDVPFCGCRYEGCSSVPVPISM